MEKIQDVWKNLWLYSPFIICYDGIFYQTLNEIEIDMVNSKVEKLKFAISAPELWGFLVDKFILVQTCDVKSLDRKWNYPQERGNLYKKVLKMD